MKQRINYFLLSSFLSLAHLAIQRNQNAIEWLAKEFQVAETNLDVLPTKQITKP